MMDKLTHIMLVEDDDNIREIAARLLFTLGGFKITACRSGQEALDVILQSKPQLVLLDVMMPGMNGYITLKKIKELTKDDLIPVVFMTAHVQTMQVEDYMKLGVIGVISKPFDPMTLVNTINNFWLGFQTASNVQESENVTEINLSSQDQEALSDLFDLFVSELPENVSQLLEKWASLKQSEWNATQWNRFFLEVHKLCGSTGTFGFHELSQALINIEILIDAQLNTIPSQKTIEEISALMQKLPTISEKKIEVPTLFLRNTIRDRK